MAGGMRRVVRPDRTDDYYEQDDEAMDRCRRCGERWCESGSLFCVECNQVDRAIAAQRQSEAAA